MPKESFLGKCFFCIFFFSLSLFSSHQLKRVLTALANSGSAIECLSGLATSAVDTAGDPSNTWIPGAMEPRMLEASDIEWCLNA